MQLILVFPTLFHLVVYFLATSALSDTLWYITAAAAILSLSSSNVHSGYTLNIIGYTTIGNLYDCPILNK